MELQGIIRSTQRSIIIRFRKLRTSMQRVVRSIVLSSRVLRRPTSAYPFERSATAWLRIMFELPLHTATTNHVSALILPSLPHHTLPCTESSAAGLWPRVCAQPQYASSPSTANESFRDGAAWMVQRANGDSRRRPLLEPRLRSSNGGI